MADAPLLHPDCASLAPLLGTWRGEGSGDYPTIEAFRYNEELTFGHVGKPFVAMIQKTRDADTGLPLHAETGYLRPQSDGTVELVVAQPSGILEIDIGPVAVHPDGLALDLESVQTIGTPSAKSVTEVRRLLTVDGDRLVSELWMAAVEEPLTHHLRAELTRV